MSSCLASTDPDIYKAVQGEVDRQRFTLEMIASENFCSPSVLAALGTPLTNKYAEGYPGRRYYGGCESVDIAETLAIERAKQLFGADHANVQPHSGSQANMAAYLALIEPGSTIMGLKLPHGGHLTHGSPVNFSGQMFKVVSYELNAETERIELDDFVASLKKHQPKLAILGASAYPRAIEFAKFAEAAHEAGAKVVADIAHTAGLVAAGLHPSPVGNCDVVTSTSHKTLRGPRGGFILCNEEYQKEIDRKVFPFSQGGPLMHVIAAKAVAFGEALQPEFKAYQQRVIDNAHALAQRLLNRGIVLVTGGTDTHLMLVNLVPHGLTGRETEQALERAGITTNRNTVPNDPQKPTITSGVRIGTPALSTRGMGTAEMEQIGDWIADVLDSKLDEMVIQRTRERVKELSDAFPLYADWTIG
ncbi:MAG: serine hydroxymethyltransferase [bacterium]